MQNLSLGSSFAFSHPFEKLLIFYNLVISKLDILFARLKVKIIFAIISVWSKLRVSNYFSR